MPSWQGLQAHAASPGSAPPTKQSSAGLFQHKTFAWNEQQRKDNGAQAQSTETSSTVGYADQAEPVAKQAGAPKQTLMDEEALLGESRKVFEVVADKCAVRADPDLEARKIATKSLGARFFVAEVTMDGWLKLHGERGWVLADMRGLAGYGTVVVPAEPGDLPIPGYHAQGIVCLEVVFCQVAVRQAPSRSAPAIAMRYKNEYVYAWAQSFSGWVRLVGEPGWMLMETQEYGKLLQPCVDQATVHGDLLALHDAWDAVRKVRDTEQLHMADVSTLKQLEASSLQNAYDAYGLLEAGQGKELVQEGLLCDEDLCLPGPWIIRRLFASSLERIVKAEPVFQAAAEHFARSIPWVRPLDVPEDNPPPLDPLAARGPEMQINGRVYVTGMFGLLIDQETQQLAGAWNPTTQQLEALPDGFDASLGVAAVEHEGYAYLMSSDGTLLDPASREITGVYNKDTQQIDPFDGGIKIRAPDAAKSSQKAAETEIDVTKHIQKGHELFNKRRLNTAAFEFERALEGCTKQRAVDLDDEIEALRGCARCWKELKEHAKLAADAERLLGFDAADEEALEWQRLATSMKRSSNRFIKD